MNKIKKRMIELGLEDLIEEIDVLSKLKRRENFIEEDHRYDDMIIQMEYAYSWAKRRCHAERRKVGAVLYKNGRPISSGFNGTKPGYPNACEKNGRTISGVIHAEKNAIVKLSKENTDSPTNSSLFVTTGTCIHCAEEVILSDISSVYFTEMYRSIDGLEELIKNGVSVYHLDMKKISDFDKETEEKGFYNYKEFPKDFYTEIYVSTKDLNVISKIEGIKKLRDIFKEYQDGKYHNKFYDAAME